MVIDFALSHDIMYIATYIVTVAIVIVTLAMYQWNDISIVTQLASKCVDIILKWNYWHDKHHQLTLSVTLIWAPRSVSNLTVSVPPPNAAWCSGVAPDYQKQIICNLTTHHKLFI